MKTEKEVLEGIKFDGEKVFLMERAIDIYCGMLSMSIKEADEKVKYVLEYSEHLSKDNLNSGDYDGLESICR